MIIGLAGPRGVGKTAVAAALSVQVDGRRMSFADPVRSMMGALLMHAGISDVAEHLYRDKERSIPQLQGRSARHLMQTLGTEWGRELVGTNLWTDLAARRARAADGCVIFDDVRFQSEVVMIREEGGIVLGLKRGGYEYTMEHQTEVPLAGVQYLTNTTPEEVAAAIRAML